MDKLTINGREEVPYTHNAGQVDLPDRLSEAGGGGDGPNKLPTEVHAVQLEGRFEGLVGRRGNGRRQNCEGSG